jgi:hypothetical protein
MYTVCVLIVNSTYTLISYSKQCICFSLPLEIGRLWPGLYSASTMEHALYSMCYFIAFECSGNFTKNVTWRDVIFVLLLCMTLFSYFYVTLIAGDPMIASVLSRAPLTCCVVKGTFVCMCVWVCGWVFLCVFVCVCVGVFVCLGGCVGLRGHLCVTLSHSVCVCVCVCMCVCVAHQG